MSKVANLIRPWDSVEAKRMLAQGSSWTSVASYFGTTTTTVRCWIDPDYAVHCRIRVNEARRSRDTDKPVLKEIYRRPPEVDTAARLAEIPADTRSLTQRLCGDPLPGRDALSRALAIRSGEQQ